MIAVACVRIVYLHTSHVTLFRACGVSARQPGVLDGGCPLARERDCDVINVSPAKSIIAQNNLAPEVVPLRRCNRLWLRATP